MSASAKIKSLDELASLLAERPAGTRVVHCHGTFDLLHLGHIRHFEEARKHGDLLVVTVTPDRFVNKGPHRPVFPDELRAEAVSALACVDYVAINRWPMAVETIKLLKPDFYAKGSDYREAEEDHTGGIALERDAIESVGGALVFTDDLVFSSTEIINRHLSVFPEDVRVYLADLAQRYSPADVLQYLDAVAGLKVLVVGDTIIDEYHYCETLGKSGKEPILAALYRRSERFAGGILAIANHVAPFCSEVKLVTLLGEQDSGEEFIRSKLKAKVDPRFVYMAHGPTIVKQRFIETYPFQKLFELYVMDEQGAATQAEQMCRALDECVSDYDVVIVGDYGHGTLSPAAIELLCDKAQFLAINTQLNAGNHGFNTVAKYRRADFISLSERELRLEARDTSGRLQDIVRGIAERLSCRRILVTRGAKGSLCYDADEGFVEVPGFAIRTVDRVGAGDTVFAIASLVASQPTPMEVVGFIGNTAGTEAVAITGNERFMERASLYKHIESLLK